ncbi:hypothetical protein BZZ01_13660 [Nostocales cyanobacterium HT-58-2]|nr:hypothetical protein BZZ01_13660 [Nostocales cyanobacterium HT-58-2]
MLFHAIDALRKEERILQKILSAYLVFLFLESFHFKIFRIGSYRVNASAVFLKASILKCLKFIKTE